MFIVNLVAVGKGFPACIVVFAVMCSAQGDGAIIGSFEGETAMMLGWDMVRCCMEWIAADKAWQPANEGKVGFIAVHLGVRSAGNDGQ